MTIDDKKLKDILVKQNYLTKEDLKKAEDYTKKFRMSFLDYLLTEGILSRDLLGRAIAEYYKVDYIDLKQTPPDRDQMQKISEEFAKKYHIILYKLDKDKAFITTDNPEQTNLSTKIKDELKIKNVKIAFSLTEQIKEQMVNYKKPLETRFSKIIASQERIAPEIIEEIIEDAIAFNASDVHFEPQRKEVIIRFRIDGVLNEAGRIKKEYYDNILNRIKVLARMRTDEHFAAQDGAIRYIKDDKNIDMRVSIVPIVDGEKISIRILSEYVQNFTMADLGLSPDYQKTLQTAGRKPFGMILVTGPTGSGKTTTLYAILRTLNNIEVNITTIEDPVEYKIEGINQIQVNNDTNLTFAKGLRSIARQDPDIILVGEIRDNETADIAVNAALTGHLLLSTFHANDAATAIPRLLDMKAEPFLLASTLELTMAQRLVRKICNNCRYSYTEKMSDLEKKLPHAKRYFGNNKEVTLYKGKGCKNCNYTGYKGRTAIFEFIQMNEELKSLVLKNPSTGQIWQVARKYGSKTLFEDGVQKAQNGVTTLDEVMRVSSPNEQAEQMFAENEKNDDIETVDVKEMKKIEKSDEQFKADVKDSPIRIKKKNKKTKK